LLKTSFKINFANLPGAGAFHFEFFGKSRKI